MLCQTVQTYAVQTDIVQTQNFILKSYGEDVSKNTKYGRLNFEETWIKWFTKCRKLPGCILGLEYFTWLWWSWKPEQAYIDGINAVRQYGVRWLFWFCSCFAGIHCASLKFSTHNKCISFLVFFPPKLTVFKSLKLSLNCIYIMELWFALIPTFINRVNEALLIVRYTSRKGSKITVSVPA